MAVIEDRILTPHLHEQMAVCDANFIRLLKLLPALQSAAGRPTMANCKASLLQRTILIPGKTEADGMMVSLSVREHFRFTTEIDVIQQRPHAERDYLSPCMLVRLYHDAKTAEVISYQHQRTHWQLPATRPGSGWHALSVEKIQLNGFLGEWLTLCLAQGMAAGPVMLRKDGSDPGH